MVDTINTQQIQCFDNIFRWAFFAGMRNPFETQFRSAGENALKL